jgi:hypothetical protein
LLTAIVVRFLVVVGGGSDKAARAPAAALAWRRAGG